jgi:hypothetical protein
MYELIKNANVEVSKHHTARGGVQAEITVNDKYIHTFPVGSRVSQHLRDMSTKELGKKLSGGMFFFNDDTLLDFREGAYKGFVHSDASISKLMDTIGVSVNQRSWGRGLVVENLEMSRLWNKAPFEVEGFGPGKDMESHLIYSWNPFVSTVRAQFELLRMICTNGAKIMQTMFNSKIPLINRWDEHLDIATRDIQHTIVNRIPERMQLMAEQRASVQQVMLVHDRLHNRAQAPTGDEIPHSDEQLDMLGLLASHTNVDQHLSKIYSSHVFESAELSALVPSHLMAIDLYNIVTEARAHTNDRHRASNIAFDMLATNLVMRDQIVDHDNIISFRGGNAQRFNRFANVDQAFFSEAA